MGQMTPAADLLLPNNTRMKSRMLAFSALAAFAVVPVSAQTNIREQAPAQAAASLITAARQSQADARKSHTATVARQVLENMESNLRAMRTYSDPTPRVGVAFARGKGGFIMEVQEGSPAAKAGLQLGDGISAFNGQDVRTADGPTLTAMIAKASDPFSLQIYHYLGNGQSTNVTYSLSKQDLSLLKGDFWTTANSLYERLAKLKARMGYPDINPDLFNGDFFADRGLGLEFNSLDESVQAEVSAANQALEAPRSGQ